MPLFKLANLSVVNEYIDDGPTTPPPAPDNTYSSCLLAFLSLFASDFFLWYEEEGGDRAIKIVVDFDGEGLHLAELLLRASNRMEVYCKGKIFVLIRGRRGGGGRSAG